MKNVPHPIKGQGLVMRKKTGISGFKKQLLFLVILFSGIYASAQPVITTLSASSGIPGASITISGSGFNTTTTNNAVYFGATKATVTAATGTSLTVTIPVGATYMPISVTNTSTGLTGYSPNVFLPTYDGSPYISGGFNFEPKYDLPGLTSSYYDRVIFADIDGDGKPDMLSTVNDGGSSGSIAIFRNTSTTGTLGAGSFASYVSFALPNLVTNIIAADINGDGKTDLVAPNNGGGFSVFRNTATSGTITSGSFATRVDVASIGRHDVAVADINSDGKPDVIQAGYDNNVVSVFQNTSSGSTISFAARVDFTTGVNPTFVRTGDIDGDGKADVVVYNEGDYGFSILRNTGTTGAVSSGSLASRVDFVNYNEVYDLFICDIDGDGKQDITVRNATFGTVNAAIYKNTATSGSITTGSLADKVEYNFGKYFTIADINGDSKPDIVGRRIFSDDVPAGAPNYYGISSGVGISFYRNTATSSTINSSTFASYVSLYDLDGTEGYFYSTYPGWNIAVCDMDGDSKPDISIIQDGLRFSISRNSPLVQPPAVSSLSATHGIPGSSVTITGTNFNSTPSSNIVYFGTSKATVTAGGTTSLTVTVPTAAMYDPVSVTNTATSLTAYSPKSFFPTFDGSAYGAVNFDPKVTFSNVNTLGGTPFLADVDGDGKLDMITNDGNVANTVSVYRNTSTSGSITSGSFASPVSFATAGTPHKILFADIDGDGKQDMIVSTYSGSVSVFRNTATSGTISSSSFAAKVDFSGTAGALSTVGDIDGDGKPELVFMEDGFSALNAFQMWKNKSVPGTINAASFGTPTYVEIGASAFGSGLDLSSEIKLADLDGDGKLDIINTRGYGSYVWISHNSSRMGAIVGNSVVMGGDKGTLVSFEPSVALGGSSPAYPYYFNNVSVGDMDGDGKQDLVYSYEGGIAIMRNTATSGTLTTGSFATAVLFTNSETVGLARLGDINGDGKPDVVCTHGDSSVSVYLNTATSGSITSSSLAAPVAFRTNYLPYNLAVGDIDGDGKADIVAGCTAESSVSKIAVLRNNPSTISGILGVYIAGTSTLTCTVSGGTWSSGSPSIATIGSSSGVVTGIASGTCVVTYTYPTTGFATAIVSVCPAPAAITGTMTVCPTATTTLSNTVSGGTWSSSNTGIATVGTSGVVTGVAAGTCIITYYTGCGTGATATITVNSTPTVAAVSGATTVCVGATTTFTDATSGGTWSSSNTARATVGSTTGIVSGVGAGTVRITYTVTNTCGPTVATKLMTVNAAPAAITGSLNVCVSSTTTLSSTTTAGTWSSSNTSVATVGSGTGVVSGVGVGTANITYTKTGCTTLAVVSVSSSPAAGTVSGAAAICPGATVTLSSTLSGGTWSSGNTSVATVGSASGDVTGVAAGTAIISYSRNNGCGVAVASATVTVNATGGAGTITGSSSVCAGSTTTLSNATGGGVWSSGSTSVATVGTSSGIVSGVAVGTSTISYSVTGSCGTVVATFNVTVGTTPGAGTITGSSSVCVGSTITLSDATGGGVWSSGNTSVATIGFTGIVTGVSAGTAEITYTITNSCGSTFDSKVVSVNAIPAAITGTLSACRSASSTLSSATTGGIWSSTSNVSMGSTSGVAFGTSDGTATISYTKSGCTVTAEFTVLATPSPNGWSPVCVGSSVAYTNTLPGGVWSSSNTARATVDAGGVVTGISSGFVVIQYTYTSTGCFRITELNVMPATPSISGVTDVCTGGTSTLANSTSGGTWASANTAIATIGSATGIMTGVAGGTTTISYIVSGGCYATAAVSVSTTAGAGTITGSSSVAAGATTTLSNAVSGGAWSSSNTLIATIGTTGVVTGVAAGTAIISYSVTNTCGTAVATINITVTAVADPCNSWAITGTPGLSSDWGSGAAIAISPTGIPYLAFRDLDGAYFNTVKRFVGGSWEMVGPAGGAGQGGNFSLAIDGSGTPYMAYNDIYEDAGAPDPGGTYRAVVRKFNGSDWEKLGGTDASSGMADYTSMTLNGSGTPYIVYQDADNGQKATVRKFNDTTWVPVGSEGFSAGVAVYTSLAMDGSGTPYVVYRDEANGNKATVKKFDGTSWVTVGSIGFSTGEVEFTNIKIDASGTPYVAYQDASAGYKATVKKFTGGSWVTVGTEGFSADITNYVSLAIDGSNTPFVVYMDYGNSMKATVKKLTGGSWVTVGNAGFTDGTAYYDAITINASGTPYVACVDGSDHKPRVYQLNSLSAITGTATVCVGATTTLSNTSTGGSWISSNTSIATVGSSSGVVSGVTSGVVTITYMLASGCYATQAVTVNTTPAAITGTASLCEGNTTTLSNTTPSGIWTSSNTSVATIGSSSGVVSGILSGTSTIAYTTSAGCSATRDVTVAATPSSISGTLLLCSGTTALSATPAGGTWSSSNTSVATVGTTGIVTAVASGTAGITYSLGAGCNSMATVTVGVTPAVITGTPSMCVGGTVTLSSATSGGAWSSSNTSVATVSGAGLVTGISAGSATISYTHSSGCTRAVIATVNAAPSANTGTPVVCVGSTTTLGNATTGGTWSSGTPAKATVNATTGVVTGVSGGTVNISYTLSAGCVSISQVTVNTSLASISGTTNVCVGLTTTFTHPIAGGVWTSSNTAFATVGSATGIIAGVAAGTPTITYTVGGCYKTKAITVNGGSLAITGNTGVCQGATSVLACTTPGGLSWSSSNPAVATIGSTSGLVTALTTGTTGITYTATTGCTSTTVVTVLPLPTAISGTMTLCQGTTTTLSSIGTTGGTWVSSVLSKATIGSSSGIVSGVGGGTSNITYTWTNGCKRTAQVTVSPLPTAGAIVGAGTMSVSATQTLAASSPGGTWASGNPGRATIVAGTGFMTGVSVGTVVITYTNTNSCGSASVTRIFSITASRQGMFAGTDENVKFSVYPNPTSGQLTIEAPVSGIFTVFTIDGRLVQEYTIADALTKLTLPNNLASGVYMCRFNGDDGSTVMTRLVVE